MVRGTVLHPAGEPIEHVYGAIESVAGRANWTRAGAPEPRSLYMECHFPTQSGSPRNRQEDARCNRRSHAPGPLAM
jgi:hypothetical protein